MNRERINKLAASYQDGNDRALSELFSAVNPLIEQASLEVEPFVEDFTKFDCRVVRNIEKLLETFDRATQDFYSAVKGVVNQDKARFIRRNSRKRNEDVMFSALEGQSEEDLGLQFEAANTDPEDEIMYRERVTLLAQGDPKKELVLSQWSKGAEDKSISELLAQRYGGLAESHRKFITRFKTDCQTALS